MSYDLWRAEIDYPTEPSARHRRATDPSQLEGFWRIHSSRMKPDWPLAIWTEAGVTYFKIGHVGDNGGTVPNTSADEAQWHDFIANAWLRSTAVEEDVYRQAYDGGYWPDGKHAKRVSDAERLDLIPDTPKDAGGNNPEPDLDEEGRPVDQFWKQISEKITAQLEKAAQLGNRLDDLETANKAAEIVEMLRGLGKQGEGRRKAEGEPHRLELAKVQAKWLPFLEPASAMIVTLTDMVDQFKRREQKRLDDLAAAARETERKRLADEAAARIAAEAAERQKEAEAHGLPAPAEPTEEEIVEEANAVAEQQIERAPPPRKAKVRVGTAHGRALSGRKVVRGKITDRAAFIVSIAGHPDFIAWCDEKANKLARANAIVDGMEIV